MEQKCANFIFVLCAKFEFYSKMPKSSVYMLCDIRKCIVFLTAGKSNGVYMNICKLYKHMYGLIAFFATKS